MENEIKMSLKKKILNSEEGKFLCLDTCLNMVEASSKKPKTISIIAYNEQEEEIKYLKKAFNPIAMKKFLVGLDEKIIGLDFCFGDIVSMQVDIGTTINEVEKGKELYAKYAPSNAILFLHNKIELAVSSDLWCTDIIEDIIIGGEYGRNHFLFRDVKLYVGREKKKEVFCVKVGDLLAFIKEQHFTKIVLIGRNKKQVTIKRSTKMEYDMVGNSEALELLFAGADQLKYKPIDQKMVKSYRKEALEAGLYEVKYKGQKIKVEVL